MMVSVLLELLFGLCSLFRRSERHMLSRLRGVPTLNRSIFLALGCLAAITTEHPEFIRINSDSIIKNENLL